MTASPYGLPPQRAAAPPPARRPRGPRGIGVVAFIVSVAALVIGAVGIALSGFSIGRALRLTDYVDLVEDPAAQGWESLGRVGVAAAVLVGAWIAHAMLAVWGLVQGIVACATDRGRVFGVVAIIIAATGWLVLAWLTQEAIMSGVLGLIPFV